MSMMQLELPFEGPYAGSSGWSGSDTSQARAERDDSSGTTTMRQNEALTALAKAGVDGLTWHELAQHLGVHHGSASGVLSVLHRTDRIARLTLVRGGSKVYVHPDFVGHRAIEEPGRRKRCCENCGAPV